MSRWMQWLRSEKGQGLVEYGLIISLVALVIMAALALFGTNLNASLNMSATTVGAL